MWDYENVIIGHLNYQYLNNFDFGVVKVVNPMDLDRAEDFLYTLPFTKADTVGLNT